jgi:hypothetical protein
LKVAKVGKIVEKPKRRNEKSKIQCPKSRLYDL